MTDSPNESDQDQLDIELRTAEAVGRRMIALSAVAHRVGFEPMGEPDEENDDAAGPTDDVEERLDWLAWLTDHALLDTLTPAEQALLSTDDADLDRDELGEQSAAAESLGALAWAVGRSELSVLDRGYPYQQLLDGVPSPWQDPRPFLDALALRVEAEIAVAREVAEILSWRAVVEVERRSADPRSLAEIEAAIADVAAELAASGVAPIGSDSDLAIGGESIRILSDHVVTSMVAAAMARLRAMNWLCGVGDWDDPALTEF